MDDSIIPIISLFTSIAGSIVGITFSYFFAIKKIKESNLIELRKKTYIKLIKLIYELRKELIPKPISKNSKKQGVIISDDIIYKLIKIQNNFLCYADDNIYRKFNNFLVSYNSLVNNLKLALSESKSIDPSIEENFYKVSDELVIMLRKKLISNSKLKKSEIVRYSISKDTNT